MIPENINPLTGLSKDYANALAPAVNFVNKMRENGAPRYRHLSFRTMEQRGVCHYDEYFESLGYEVSELEDAQIGFKARLDELVTKINTPFAQNLGESEVCRIDGAHFPLIADSTERAVNLINHGREEI